MILLTQGASVDRLFDLDWQLLADASLMIVAVFVLFIVMGNLLFNPAREMLNNRKEKIRGELESAANDMEEARRLKEEYETRLKEIDREAESILSEARRKALNNESQIVARAKEEANHILERARVEAELEKQKLSDEVKREIVSVASIMAGKIVTASIDTTVQDQLIEDTLKEMGDKTWLK